MMRVTLTKETAKEVGHKLTVLAETEELCEDYGITVDEARKLADSVPDCGVWEFQEAHASMIAEELSDHMFVLTDIAKENPEDRRKLKIIIKELEAIVDSMAGI